MPHPTETPWLCLFYRHNAVSALLSEPISSCWYSSDLGSCLISLKLSCLIAFVRPANSQRCKWSRSENISKACVYNRQGSKESWDLVKYRHGLPEQRIKTWLFSQSLSGSHIAGIAKLHRTIEHLFLMYCSSFFFFKTVFWGSISRCAGRTWTHYVAKAALNWSFHVYKPWLVLYGVGWQTLYQQTYTPSP